MCDVPWIAVGKLVGMALGLIGLMTIPYLWTDLGWMERIGFLLWYTTVGAVIGMFGVMTWYPILQLPMPWWFRSTLIGAWMNFVLTLFIYDALTVMLVDLFGENSPFQSPFWFVAEGCPRGSHHRALRHSARWRRPGDGAVTFRSRSPRSIFSVNRAWEPISLRSKGGASTFVVVKYLSAIGKMVAKRSFLNFVAAQFLSFRPEICIS